MDYCTHLRNLYRENANPEYAVWMKKYMRNQFEFFGIRGPILKQINKTFYAEHGLPQPTASPQIVKTLWQWDEREFQFFAMNLLVKMKKQMPADAIDLYEFLVTQKSWWDTVDQLAAGIIGYHFIRFPEQIIPYTEKWMDSTNFWLQRSALLFQLKYKKETDFELMSRYILRLMHEKEFFIRKAIGWVLREYSKSHPQAVIDFVEQHHESLSGLSKREAMKHMERKKNSPT
jgi:3-methyladenine DNA glycosylase AlkD